MMIIIAFVFEENLKWGTMFVHQCFYLSTQNVFQYLKLTIYRLRVVEKGSTAGGAKSMSSDILLFLRKKPMFPIGFLPGSERFMQKILQEDCKNRINANFL
jgi:hypothetical protein